MNSAKLNYQTLFIKWLLAIILLTGALSFPGAALQARSKQDLSCTEAAHVSIKQAVKSLSYKAALKPAHICPNVKSIFSDSTIDLAYFDTLRAEIRNKACNDKNICRRQNSFFYQPKINSSQKSDDPASS